MNAYFVNESTFVKHIEYSRPKCALSTQSSQRKQSRHSDASLTKKDNGGSERISDLFKVPQLVADRQYHIGLALTRALSATTSQETFLSLSEKQCAHPHSCISCCYKERAYLCLSDRDSNSTQP